MSDEAQATIMQQPVAKKDGPIGGPNKQGNRGGKRATTPRNVVVQGSKPDTRPSSRGSNHNKKDSAQQNASGNKQRGGNSNARDNAGGGRGGRRTSGNASNQQQSNRAQRSASGAGQQTSNESSPADDSAGALANLNRLVLEMKGLAPNEVSSESNTPNSGVVNPQQSKLPADAPVFQPGAGSYPGLAGRELPPRHAKAASVGGAPAPQMNFSSSYSPNLGSMNEDMDDGAYEEGEIAEQPYAQGMHVRSQSQGFTAPRFAALARENQGDQLGPSGRPQLAPSFTFGARRRGTNPMTIAPAISEEDANFQFPQQQQQQQESLSQPQEHRRSGSNGEITGIMAEQVSHYI